MRLQMPARRGVVNAQWQLEASLVGMSQVKQRAQGLAWQITIAQRPETADVKSLKLLGPGAQAEVLPLPGMNRHRTIVLPVNARSMKGRAQQKGHFLAQFRLPEGEV